MKIAAVCCTFRRPKQLGHMIRCFERQDYQNRELVVLDDAGQYKNTQGDRWRLVSVSERFATLGQKRNAVARLVSPDVEALAIWDDDDLYLPWALRASVAALQAAPWSRPSVVLHPQPDGSLRQHETGGLFQGDWAVRRSAFDQVAGYPAANRGEDKGLAIRLIVAGFTWADPARLGFQPFYVYDWSGQHLSTMPRDAYDRLGAGPVEAAGLMIADPPSLDLDVPRIREGVEARVF